MNFKVVKVTVFLLVLVQLSSCNGSIPITGQEQTKEANPTPADSTGDTQVIGTVSNVRTQVHAGARDSLQLIDGETELGNEDFVSVTDGGKARLEFPGPVSLLMFNQSDMDGIKLEYDQNSNPRIVNRLIRGGFSGYVAPGNQLTVDLAFGVKVNVLGTNFFIIYDEETGVITIGKFDGTLTVSVPGQPIVKLGNSELVDIASDRVIKHYSPLSFTPSQFEQTADRCNSPIQAVNILRRDNDLPLPGETVADKNKDLPCGSRPQTGVTPASVTETQITWVDLDYCRRSDKDICVYSLGLLNQDMMITVQVKRPDISELYILIDHDNRYPCKAISTSQNKYYCVGGQIRPNTTVLVQVFHQDVQLLVQGDFLIPSLVIHPTPRPRPRATKYPY
jgi:hypothetical protein